MRNVYYIRKSYKAMILFTVIVAIFLGSSSNSTAQDFHLSQYNAAPLYLNPAMTGMFSGSYRAHIHYRDQWRSVASPFTTAMVAFDMPWKKFGIGAMILNDRAGVGNYNVLNFNLAGAYDFAIDSAKQHHFSVGPQIGFIHKSVNMDKLLFQTQYTNSNSGGFDPGLPNGEITSNASIILPDLNLGVMYYYSNDKFVVNPFIGFSVFHITQPKQSFYENDSRLPRRYVFHLGTKINLTPLVQITPQMFVMNQVNANEKTISMEASYYLKSQDSWVFTGITYRSFEFKEFSTNDAFILLIGMKYSRFTGRISYDINTSSLTTVSNGRGGIELSLTYVASKVRIPKPSCPRL